MSFLTTSNWDPGNDNFGAWVAIYGTLVSSLLALVIAVPLGVGTAIFITEDSFRSLVRRCIGFPVFIIKRTCYFFS